MKNEPGTSAPGDAANQGNGQNRRPDQDGLVIDALRRVDTPTLANAIDTLGVRSRASGFCSREMRQLIPELGTLCGYAVTVQAIAMTPDTVLDRGQAVDRYLEVCAALAASPQPAVVVFQETGPFPAYSVHLGEVLATLFRRFGAMGVVSNGAVRDLAQIRTLGFHAFAPGTVAGRANLAVLRVQAPVTVCGLTVHPGDLLHGDENGLITVPAEGRDRLPELVERIRNTERRVLDYLAGEDVTLDGVRERMVH